MKMNFKPVCLGFAAVMLAAPVLQAEEVGNAALGFGLTTATDSLRKVTHSTLGLNVNGSIDFNLGGTLKMRPGFGITVLPGKDGVNYDVNGTPVNSKTQLVNLQCTFDLVIPTGTNNAFSVITGLSINQWRYSGSTKDGSPHPFGLDGSRASDNVKLGLRLGLNYQVSQRWTAEALLQMVEFGSKTSFQSEENVNPCWMHFGMKYRF